MKDERHNGWANYATWRAALELFDGIEPGEMFDGWAELEPYDRAQLLKAHAEELVFSESVVDLVAGWAIAFLSDVNWHEIAENLTRAEDERA
jgi:hypothetical protein